MKYLKHEFTKRCKAKYSYLGFKNYKQSFSRVINDVLQCFNLKIIGEGHYFTIEFRICALCSKIIHPDMGLYELNGLNQSFDIYYNGWNYNKVSKEELNKSLDDMFKLMDDELMPYFIRAADCKTAFIYKYELDKKMFDIKSSWLKHHGISNDKISFETEAICDTDRYYMALKTKNFEYAKKYLQAMIKLEQENYYWYKNEITKGKDSYLQSSMDSKIFIESLEKQLKKIVDKDYQFFKNLVSENERLSIENLREISTKTGKERLMFIIDRVRTETGDG